MLLPWKMQVRILPLELGKRISCFWTYSLTVKQRIYTPSSPRLGHDPGSSPGRSTNEENMTTERKTFDNEFAEIYHGLLKKIVESPPPPSVLDSSVTKRIQIYLDSFEIKNCVSVWNFYKNMLDLVVRYSLGNGFILNLLDLEKIYKAPNGSFSEEAGNMNKAPWRGF